jgi:glycosyltransferase involved in cell wall biosynthesis
VCPPLVSIVIPAYQCAGTISKALDSVFAQTFTAYEVILVNDGSPDSPQLRRVLAPYLGRIRYIQQANRGPSGARNAGIERAHGKYIAFLDSDDFWLEHHLGNQVQLLAQDPSLGLVYANPLILDGSTPVGDAFGLVPQSSPVTFQSLALESSRIPTSSVVASREQIVTAGSFDETMRRCEDFDLWLRMAHNGCRIAFSREVQLCHHRMNGLSSDRLSMKRARIQVYEKMKRLPTLSAEERRTVERKIALGKGEYQVELAKAALLEKNYEEALIAAKRANDVLDNWKLRLALRGLKTAPRLLLESYRAYEQILDARNRNRSMKRSRLSESTNNRPSFNQRLTS